MCTVENQNATLNCDRIYLSAENKRNPGFSVSLCTSCDLFGDAARFCQVLIILGGFSNACFSSELCTGIDKL